MFGTETESEIYTLSALLGRQQSQLEDHRGAYQAIKVDKAQIPTDRIHIDCKIAGIEGCPQLLTSELKKPDLQIISDDQCVLVLILATWSVQSESLGQLCWLRNHITKCGGFYFMSGRGSGGHVIYVEIVWVDKLLKFKGNRHKLSKDSVATKIKQVMHEAQRSLEIAVGRPMTGFALPISRNFCCGKLWSWSHPTALWAVNCHRQPKHQKGLQA